MHIETHRTGNRLLDQLATQDLQRLSHRMERLVVPLHGTILRPGEAFRYAHFPLTNVLSSIVVLDDGSAVEAAAIGNEGVADVGLLVGQRASSYLIVQQVEGESLRVPVAHFQTMLRDSLPLRDLVERYALILLRHCAQNAACNARHGAEARMSRWLLSCADRADRDRFDITQDYLGAMLGVSRQSVNTVIHSLERQGLVDYQRRHLTILDREGLEQSACECYKCASDTYDEMMYRSLEAD